MQAAVPKFSTPPSLETALQSVVTPTRPSTPVTTYQLGHPPICLAVPALLMEIIFVMRFGNTMEVTYCTATDRVSKGLTRDSRYFWKALVAGNIENNYPCVSGFCGNDSFQWTTTSGLVTISTCVVSSSSIWELLGIMCAVGVVLVPCMMALYYYVYLKKRDSVDVPQAYQRMEGNKDSFYESCVAWYPLPQVLLHMPNRQRWITIFKLEPMRYI